MKILQVQAQHIDQVVELFDAYRVWYGKRSDKATATQFLSERTEKNESVIFACENSDAKFVGFTQLYPVFSSTRMRPMWLLNDLFVSPEFRGQGVSKKLIESAKELARSTNACGVLLETETTNDIGNHLYPSVGFELEENNFYFWTNGS
ncbi:MAG: GNAT family N-acetyltransferase [Mariniblastus sp.]